MARIELEFDYHGKPSEKPVTTILLKKSWWVSFKGRSFQFSIMLPKGRFWKDKKKDVSSRLSEVG